MPIDPLTAFGLAANILQLLEFGGKLFQETKEIYHSVDGATVENLEIKDVATKLSSLSELLSTPCPDRSSTYYTTEKAIWNLALQSKTLVNELSAAIPALDQAERSHGKWQSFRQAVRTMWNKDKIFALKKRLDDIRQNLSIHLVTLMSSRQNETLKHLDDINKNLGQFGNRLPESIEILDSSIRGLIRADQAWNLERMEMIESRLSECLRAVLNLPKSTFILDSLRYERMTARFNSIVDAHEKTYEWILDPHWWPPSDPRSHIHFRSWLRQEDGIYWITGKPGSGKSTLMKFLSESKQTSACLKDWAGTSRLCKASFYFYILGTDMQRSLQGLLQQLLFEVLRNCPDLFQTLCATRWEHNSEMQKSWSLKELAGALGRLNECNSSSTKFCFFIDGLDEYYGDHLELIKVIRKLARIPSVKLCVSSRNWPCFEDAFGEEDQRKLYLQDLTRTDMTKFAHDVLAEHPRSIVFGKDNSELQKLVSEIVQRAEGVFLWTRLVVRSLSDGMSNGDSLYDLHRRLSQLPSDLEDFFKRIIESVDKFYERQMAAIFQVMLRAPKPLPLLVCSYVCEESAPCRISDLLATPEAVSEVFQRTTVTLQLAEMDAERQINGRFKGLLEPQRTGIPGHREVNFLHRTLSDFLQTRGIQDLLASHLDTSFSSSISTCEAFLSLAIKHPGSLLDTDVDEFMYFAYAADIECENNPNDVDKEYKLICMIEELDNVHTQNGSGKFNHERFSSSYQYQGVPLESNTAINSQSIVGRALISGVTTFIRHRIRQDPEFLKRQNGVALSLAITRPSPVPARSVENMRRMTELLLREGADLNQKAGHLTLFEAFVVFLSDISQPEEVLAHGIRILPVLLQYGANVNTFFSNASPKVRWYSIVIENLLRNGSIMSKDVDIFRVLFANGLDPNMEFQQSTVWAVFVHALLKCEKKSKDRLFSAKDAEVCALTNLFLQHGANWSASIYSDDDDDDLLTTPSVAWPKIFASELWKKKTHIVREQHTRSANNLAQYCPQQIATKSLLMAPQRWIQPGPPSMMPRPFILPMTANSLVARLGVYKGPQMTARPCGPLQGPKEMDLEDMDSEDMDSEDMDSEDMDSEDMDSEDMDSEDMDLEDMDSEDMDAEDVDMDVD